MVQAVSMTSIVVQLGFKQPVANFYHTDEKINSMVHLPDLIQSDLKTNLVKDLCYSVCKPGVGVGQIVPAWDERLLSSACFLARWWDKINRVNVPGDILLTRTLFVEADHQRSLLKSWDNMRYEVFPPSVTDMKKSVIVTSCINEFKEFAVNIYIINKIPLIYLLCHEFLAPDAACDPSGDYNSL